MMRVLCWRSHLVSTPGGGVAAPPVDPNLLKSDQIIGLSLETGRCVSARAWGVEEKTFVFVSSAGL